MPFTDDDLKRVKDGIKTGNFDWTEALLPQQMHALLARLEAAENVSLAVENANTFLIGIDIPKEAHYLLRWFGIDWKHILETVQAWRKAAGKESK